MPATVDRPPRRPFAQHPHCGAYEGASPDVVDFVSRWGRSSVSPFHGEPGRTIVDLGGHGVAGYAPIRRWAVLPTDVISRPENEREALDALIGHLQAVRRRPVFTAVTSPEPYRRLGYYTLRIADDPGVDLAEFSLDGPRMSSLRHSINSARRSGLRVVPWSNALEPEVTRVSEDWLRTKRGGEMGFTLGRFDLVDPESVDCRAAVDSRGNVVGFTTWRRYQNGRGRVLDIMRRSRGAPNPTMDLLIGESLLEFAAAGVRHASLGPVPLSHGPLGERVYPTVSLRRYKEKFAPTWQPLWLVSPSRLLLPAALRAIAHAYCPDGMVNAVRRNA